LSAQYEISLLNKHNADYWISAGDRNFHLPRDVQAYESYLTQESIHDSKINTGNVYGVKTTFLGYEDHPRMSKISASGLFEKEYYLDVIFHKARTMKSIWWLSHCGEYNENGQVLEVESFCRQPEKRLFASDHTAIFIEFELINFWQ
jgi:hypothetical protein